MLSKRYIPEIDTLRFVAVGGVVIFHTRLGGVFSEIGWMGVWLFFVISGFVITLTLISKDYEGISFSDRVKKFWIRRSLRIFPLYYTVIIVCILISSIYTTEYFKQLPSLATFTYNFYRIFNPDNNGDIFGHFWSLSVEEQFYLIFPAVAFAMMLDRRKLQIVLLCVVIGSPILRLLAGNVVAHYVRDQKLVGDAIYQLSFVHFDSFAIGALVALNFNALSSSTKPFYVMVGVSILLIAIYATICVAIYNGSMNILGAVFHGFRANAFGKIEHIALYSVINFTFATMIVGILSRSKPYIMALDVSPVQYLGRISYGLYVYHMPILLLYNNYGTGYLPKVNSLPGFLTYVATLVIISTLSFHFFEKPILNLRKKFQ